MNSAPGTAKRTVVWSGRAVCLCALVLSVARPAHALESTRALAAGLQRAGRAEATLTWRVMGPPGSAPRALRGVLAVEPPSSARLDIAATGERITLREDGGEWLQPRLQQFVKLTPRHSVAAMRWWRLFAGAGSRPDASPGRVAPAERRVGPRHYRLVLPATPYAEADSADIWLDPRGLPSRLELADGMGGRSGYRLSGWRFVHTRGVAAFRLTAPPGVETVELP